MAGKQSDSDETHAIFLFTDGSVNNQTRVGYGAYLLTHSLDIAPTAYKRRVTVKRFENTSSSQLEIETFLWAISECPKVSIKAFSDSQTLIRLPERRHQLEAQDFRSKSGKPLNQGRLYREFFQVTDRLSLTLHKVKGHSPTRRQEQRERLFALVDRASRTALRTNP